jgi:hypothetical protein
MQSNPPFSPAGPVPQARWSHAGRTLVAAAFRQGRCSLPPRPTGRGARGRRHHVRRPAAGAPKAAPGQG